MSSSSIPAGQPGVSLDEMLWNVSPAAPIVMSCTTSAGTEVVARVLPGPVAVIVPPPVALKAAPPSSLPVRISVPVKAIVAPALSKR